MRSAYFEDEPDAEAAAIVLRDLGFNAVVRSCTTETFAQTIGKFFRGEIGNWENNAVLESDNAPYQSFEIAIIRHGGRVVGEGNSS
jgi:hypothetical protein